MRKKVFLYGGGAFLILLLPCLASAQIANTEWIIPQQSGVSAIAVSSNGRFAATAGWTDVKIWDVPTASLLTLFRLPPYRSAALAFGPDRPQLAIVQDSPFRIRMYDVDSRRVVFDITDTLVSGAGSLAFSPTGAMLAIASADSIRLWSALDGSRIRTMTGRVAQRNSLQFSGDGEWLYAAGVYGVEMWEVATGRHFYPLLDQDTVVALAVSPDDRTAAVQIRRSWEDPDPVRLWDLTTGDSIRTLPVSNIDGQLHFSPDGTELMTSAQGLQVWEVATGTLRREITNRVVDAFGFSASGTTLLISSKSGNIEIRDRLTGDSIGPLTPLRRVWRHLRFSPTGDRVAVGYYGYDYRIGIDESGIGLIDAATGEYVLPRRIDAGSPWDYDFEFSPDGRYMAGIWGNGVRLAHVSSGDSIRTMRIPGIQRIGPSLSWSPDNSLIATSGDTLGRVHVWRFDGELDRTLATANRNNNVVRFSPDGRWLVALGNGGHTSVEHHLSVWNTTTWERATIDTDIDTTYYQQNFLEFLPDNRTVAIGGYRSVVGLWDILSGTRIGELVHDAAVRDVAIARDGRHLVTAVLDGTLRVWDLLSRQIVHTYVEYPIAHLRVEISPDSKQIISMAEDGSVIMWRAIDRMSGVTAGPSRRAGSFSMAIEPTPVDGPRATLRFDPAFRSEGDITITDMSGNIRRVVKIRPMQSRVDIDFADLPNGIYVVRAVSGNDVSIERLVIAR